MDGDMLPRNGRKRVRFDEDLGADADDGEDDNEDPSGGNADTRTRLPPKVVRYHEAVLDVHSEEGPVKAMDPNLAAMRRARYRAESQRLQRAEDTEVPDDIAAAEENYDDPEEAYNDMGIPIEPFHLRKEREEGYFDADGNYIEYRLDHLRDAWLDTLDEGGVKIDNVLACKLLAAAEARDAAVSRANGREAAGEEEETLDEEDLAIFRKRTADLLAPGETVLQGLRRLGHGLKRHQAAPLSTSQRQALRKLRKQEQQQQQQEAEQAGHQAQRLGGSDPMEAEAAAGGVAGAGPGPSSVDHGNGSSRGTPAKASGGDMVAAGGPAGAGAGAGAASPAGPGSAARGGSAGKAIGAAPPPPPQLQGGSDGDTSIAFDKLTALADKLLSSGQFNIYNETREQLLRAAQGVLGTAVTRQAGSGAAPQRAPALGAPAPAAAAGAAAAGAAKAGGGEAGGDVDMFGAEEDAVQEGAAGAGKGPAQRQAGASRGADEGGRGAAASGPSAGAASPGGNDDKQDDEEEDGASREGGDEGELKELLKEFVLDSSTNYLYSSALGYYYDPSTSLFGDASTGQWFKFDSGQYVPV